MNTVPNQARRMPLAGRFDADATRLLAGGADRSAPGGSRRRAAGMLISDCSRSQGELPCQTHDPDLWFAEAPGDVEQAKELCRNCPAQLACLTGAIERREPTGVWGGQLLDKGEIVTHKRPRGRPRKGSTVPQRQPYEPLTASLAPTDVEGAA